MRQLRSSSLVPPGFIVEHAERDSTEVRVTLRPRAGSSLCTGCSTAARRVHGRCHRTLADLPMAGRTVRLRLEARRFRCDATGCRRHVFAERVDPEVLAPWARRTSRLARRLMLRVGKDALLRVVRRRGRPQPVPPPVIGIDDWAWCSNQRYGTSICDLERRRTIARLPDREPATARARHGASLVREPAADRGHGP